MKIEPAGHRVIVKPDPLSEIEQKELEQYESLKASGFEISDQKDKKRKEQAVHTGVVGSVGAQAWIAFALDIIRAKDDLLEAGWSLEAIKKACQPWAKVGDRVHFAKYGGYAFDESGESYRLLNDEDITAIIREGAQ